MRYRYIITPQVKEDVEGMNFGKQTLEKLQMYLESKEKWNDTPLMANVYISKPKMHSAPRFIWFQRQKEDVCLFILRKIYEHDEYRKKINDVTKDAWARSHALTPEEEEFVDGVFNKMIVREVRQPLPDEYIKYEERPRRFEETSDVIIYELPEWVTGYQEVDDKLIHPIYERLYDVIVDGNYDNVSQDSSDTGFLFTDAGGFKVCFRTEVNSSGSNELKAVYLLQVGREINEELLKGHKYDTKSLSALRRKSAKCYPQFILLDYPTWTAVEEDNDANLALSTEELNILQEIEYPFFVSGLAGSGKSTILYYLFAHALDYEVKKGMHHDMLFLSYSKKLVANAMRIVKSILCHHPSYSLVEEFKDKSFEREFEHCFQPFQDFIKTEFLNEEECRRFSRNKYIDYQTFKNLYEECQLQEKRKYSSDIVWSVIRTFIKGKDSETYFTPEEYSGDKLSAKDRTVATSDYANIYKIWDSWYRKIYEEGEGWDDLDLVRYALHKEDSKDHFHKYAVVFCDEAQDFTKVETDLILKLSVHSKYDLTQQEGAEKIPVAFAGDPNQTVNPTGFRWGSTQETFNQSFRESLGSFRGFRPNILKTNYRSREGIVNFANTIQCLRHHFLSDGHQALSLQHAWSGDENISHHSGDSVSYVSFYPIEEYERQIMAGLQKSTIITADEGEYVVGDELGNDGTSDNKQLKYTEDCKKALGLENFNDNSHLYTAITSKGLEFKSVILFKFSSDKAVDLFPKIMSGQRLSNESELYNLSHFFTKLYIAISRAKQILFIVDTKEGYEKLWKYFIDNDLWNKFLNAFVQDNQYKGSLGRVSMGNIEDFSNLLAENYNPKEYAEALFKNAIDEESRDTMNRARSAFKEARLEDKAILCEAYMAKFDRSFKDAGDSFSKLGKYNDAVECYWEGQCWDDLLTAMPHLISSKDKDNDVKRSIASFMTSDKNSPAAFLEAWREHENDYQENIVNGENRDNWESVLQKVERLASGLQSSEVTNSLIDNLDHLAPYIRWYKDGLSALRAQLHFERAEFVNRGIGKDSPDFNADDYLKAIRLWESGSNRQATMATRNYYKAKKLTASNVNEEIVWMSRLNENDDIIKKYGSNEMASSLSEEAQSVVFSCLLPRDFEQAAAYPYPKDPQLKWSRLYNQDKARFLTFVVLQDFTADKFNFIQDIALREESPSVFSQKLPQGVFDEIFDLSEEDGNGRPYWTYFTCDLKDNEGQREMFSFPANRPQIAKALADRILSAKKIDKTLASCFLQTLFDSEFNQERAENFLSCIVRIFHEDIFFKEDFRGSAQRNIYYSIWSNLTGDELDTIKNNIRKFVDQHLDAMKKVGKGDVKEVKALFRAYEIAAPYQGFSPDYANIVNMYNRKKKGGKFKSIDSWIHGRIAFNRLLDDNLLQKASYAKFAARLDEVHLSPKTVAEDFSMEDAIMFIIIVSFEGKYSFEATMLTAKLIYKHHLKREFFRPYCRMDSLADHLSDSINVAIDEILSNNEHIDEDGLKFLAFVWERFYDSSFTANRYDNLAGRERLKQLNLEKLIEYFRKRALLHYSYGKQSLYKQKEKEYHISMTREQLPPIYPVIRDGKGDGIIYTTGGNKGKGELPHIPEGGARQPQKPAKPAAPKPAKKRPEPKKPVGSAPNKPDNGDALSSLEIARNLKKMGLTLEQIQQATHLSMEELSQL